MKKMLVLSHISYHNTCYYIVINWKQCLRKWKYYRPTSFGKIIKWENKKKITGVTSTRPNQTTDKKNFFRLYSQKREEVKCIVCTIYKLALNSIRKLWNVILAVYRHKDNT